MGARAGAATVPFWAALLDDELARLPARESCPCLRAPVGWVAMVLDS
jgi:hypothetical protein